MVIDSEKVVIPVHEIIYLGDVFNDMGNNDGLIKDRVKRAIKATISIRPGASGQLVGPSGPKQGPL